MVVLNLKLNVNVVNLNAINRKNINLFMKMYFDIHEFFF